MTDARWSWSEIDLGAISRNVAALRALTTSREFMAVVKADGYGHGAVHTARAAIAGGATRLGVACVEEAVRLRDAGISCPIQLLSEPPEASVAVLIDREITPALFTREFAGALGRAAAARGLDHPYHLKVDTGMNRVGVRAEEAPQFAAMLAQFPGIRLEGTFTHFATADVPDDWDALRQLQRFTTTLEGMRTEGVNPGLVHAANSAATILYPESHFDMVRCGIAIYGLHPSLHTKSRIDLTPAMSVKARATMVKRLAMGDGVSYGLTYHAGSPTTVATLPLGYADGVHRVLSNRMQVLGAGRRLAQVGRVCMDQLVVEIPRDAAIVRGDELVIVGAQGPERIVLDELADMAGTVNYELACAFGMRLERIYL